MFVQQDVIDLFYIELKRSLEKYPSKTIIERLDESFLKFRPKHDNLSIDFWKKTISKRMNFDSCIFTDESPFYSYNVNRCWLRLAFDISKIISANPKEYRNNWLKILYPKLLFSHREYYLDPVLFTPYFKTGNVNVYLVNSLPKFASFKDVKKNKSAPGVQRILHDYNLDFYESYFYVLTTSKFYYVFADGSLENVFPNIEEPFLNSLLTLFKNPKILEDNSLEKIKSENLVKNIRVHNVEKSALEELIINFGGYPNLDLRTFYISDNYDKLFSINSFLNYRGDIQLYHSSMKMKFTLNTANYGANFNDFNNYKDVLPHVVFEHYNDTRPRPLSLFEFARLRHKDDYRPHTNGNEKFTLLRRIINKTFLDKWSTMHVTISRQLLMDLIQILRTFYTVSNLNDFNLFKKKLNNWSKQSLYNNFQQIFNVYNSDLKILLSEQKYLFLKNKCLYEKDKIFWFADNIREIYKFYSIILKINLDEKYLEYQTFDLFMNIILETNYDNVKPDIFAILLYCLNECPDQLESFVNLTEYSSIRFQVISYKTLLNALKSVFNSSLCNNKKDIENVIKELESIKNSKEIPQYCIKKIINVYHDYDNKVKFTENDHNKALNSVNSCWINLAKLLTGLGYFKDYLQLLCPNLSSYTDVVTGKPFSYFDLRHLIFTPDRKYLINLSHSRCFYKVFGLTFNCSTPKIQYLSYIEVEQIKKSSSKFSNYYHELVKKNLNIPQFNYRIIIALRRLVSATSNFNKQDKYNYDIQINDKLVKQQENYFEKVKSYYNNAMGIITIKISSVARGISCYINFNNSQKNNISCTIYNYEFSREITYPLTNENFKQYKLELIYLLRKKALLPLEYNEDHEKIINNEYIIFNKFYCNLSEIEKNLLDSTIVDCKTNVMYFKDLYRLARYDITTINTYFENMLWKLCSNDLAKNNYFSLFSSTNKNNNSVFFKDPRDELDKLYVSLMTHYFVPEHSLPIAYLNFRLFDTPIDFPMHTIFPLIIKSFDKYFAELDQDKKSDKIDNKYNKYLDKIFECLYQQIDKYYNLSGFEGGYFQEVYSWIVKVISGELFKFMNLFEIKEVLAINSAIEDSGEFFSAAAKDTITIFIKEIQSIASGHASDTKSVINIKLIKFLASLSRYDLRLKSELEASKVEPYTIYLDLNGEYLVSTNDSTIYEGKLPARAVDLIDLNMKIFNLDFKKKILNIVARAGHISLAENDFPIIFKIIYTDRKLKCYAKKLINMFLIGEGFEETNDEEIKKIIIDRFQLNCINFVENKNENSIFSNVVSFEQIFDSLVKTANTDTSILTRRRTLSLAVGWSSWDS